MGEAREYCVLVLCAWMARMPARLDGPARHDLICRFLSSGAAGESESELPAWIREYSGAPLNAKSYGLCRKDADRWREEGIRVAEPADSVRGALDSIAEHERSPCPAVLFVRGEIPEPLPWGAVFNSRKPRSISTDSSWLAALRFALGEFSTGKITVAGSTGTLTYDLVTAHAMRAGLPSAIVTPFPIARHSPEGTREPLFPGSAVISCLPATNACPEAARVLCRDRLLAGLSHVHLVIELRRGGNLVATLDRAQTACPGPLAVFDPGEKTPRNAGNYQLLEKFAARSRRFSITAPARHPDSGPDNSGGTIVDAKGERLTRSDSPQGARAKTPCTRENHREQPGAIDRGNFLFHLNVRVVGVEGARGVIDWDNFLFHYTRACPGPWPGQSREEYLLGLLDADPFSDHTALDTLVRILVECRIRSGNKMVRGVEPVVCWSSHPPGNYRTLRKWNSSLARWTIEPYGIAVSRSFLRDLGVKPAIYGRDSVHDVLPLSERFRFQLSGDGRADWRNEREWRFRGDFEIAHIPDGKWFAFVPSRAESEIILRKAGVGVPVIAFEEILSLSGDSS